MMTPDTVLQQIEALAEPTYRQFNQKLLPGVTGIVGVRMPALRKIAKAVAKEDWQAYLSHPATGCYEEILVRGLVIGFARADMATLLPYIETHARCITNWSTCDIFCGALKTTKDNLAEMWAFLQPYFAQDDPYALRFGIVMLLNYYLDDAYIDRSLALLTAVNHEHYYVKMAVAWALSMAYVARPDKTLPCLQGGIADDWTHNKTLQKIIESRQVDDATRDEMRALKRKKGREQDAQG